MEPAPPPSAARLSPGWPCSLRMWLAGALREAPPSTTSCAFSPGRFANRPYVMPDEAAGGRSGNTRITLMATRFLYQAASWKAARWVVAKVEFHAGELFPRVGFIVTNLERSMWGIPIGRVYHA